MKRKHTLTLIETNSTTITLSILQLPLDILNLLKDQLLLHELFILSLVCRFMKNWIRTFIIKPSDGLWPECGYKQVISKCRTCFKHVSYTTTSDFTGITCSKYKHVYKKKEKKKNLTKNHIKNFSRKF